MTSLVEKMDTINDLKRKTGETDHPVADLKKPRISPVGSPDAPIDLSKINNGEAVESMDINSPKTEQKIITPEDIRKLKEILRQEEAKLQLIKRIKASINQCESVKPKVKIGGATIAKVEVTVPTSIQNGKAHHLPLRKSEKENGIPKVNQNGIKKEVKTERSSSPVTSANEKMVATGASFERNREKREELKRELNKTLNRITTTPTPPQSDVNFFPSATNNEFLVLLGLEMCVNRLKKEDKGKMDMDAHCCEECGKDFSPSWKYDTNGRLLCSRCISTNELKDLSKKQKTKFDEFTEFWSQKEIELKEIETQLQKDEKEMRQMKIDADRENRRRAEELRKRQEAARLKEQNAKKMASGMYKGLDKNTQKFIQSLYNKNGEAGNLSNFGKTGANSAATTATLNALRNMGGINNLVNNQLVQQLQRLANAGKSSANQVSATDLARIHEEKIKLELMQKMQQQAQEQEKARQRKVQEQILEQQRRLQQQRQQQQQQLLNSQNTASSANMLRLITALQTNLANAGSSGMGNAQQLQQLLAANPASLNPVLQALANHARGASGTRSPSTDRQHYMDILSNPPKAHSNKR